MKDVESCLRDSICIPANAGVLLDCHMDTNHLMPKPKVLLQATWRRLHQHSGCQPSKGTR